LRGQEINAQQDEKSSENLYEYLHTFKFPACDAWGIFQFKFQIFPMRILQYVPLGLFENKFVRTSQK